MKHKLLRQLVIVFLAVFAVSCADEVTKDEPGGGQGEESDKVCFIVSDKDTPRGIRSDGLRGGVSYIKSADGSDSLYLGLTVSEMPKTNVSRAAHITTNDYALRMSCVRRRSGNVYDYYFANTKFTKNTAGIWVSDPEYWWLDANVGFKFYGYAPAEVEGATFIGDKQTWEPKIDYTVPTDVEAQTDLLYSEPLSREVWTIATPQSAVSLNMKHALACIGFKTDKDMASGTINSITIRNAVGRGTLNLADGEWTLDTNKLSDFHADIGLASHDDTELTTDESNKYFMLLPGSVVETTTVEVDFTAADGTNTVYSGRLEGDWKAGNQYLYYISIGPELDITVVPETQDAHYVICRTHVSVADHQNEKQWTLTVTADDGADVTVTDELNVFQQQGFWIDEIREAGRPPVSARGTSTLTSTGDRDVYIFLPENATTTDRTITLTLKESGQDNTVSEKTFKQVRPAWIGTFAWEQLDDESHVQFGFLWTRTAYWRYTYGYEERQRGFISLIVDMNKARDYADIEVFGGQQNLGHMIYIDYSKLTNLNGQAESTYDGLYNTSQLYEKAGSGALGALEPVVNLIYKTEGGQTTERAFRLGDGTPGEAPAPTGESEVTISAVGVSLLKNRWFLIRIVSEYGDIGYMPLIDEQDMVWYLPSVDQFKTLPRTVIDPIVPSECWSSTVKSVWNSNELAYKGDGTTENRLALHKVRACRKQ